MRESEARRDAGICLRPQANWWNTHSEVLRPGQGQGVTYLDKQEDLGSGSASLQITEGPGQGNSGLEAQVLVSLLGWVTACGAREVGVGPLWVQWLGRILDYFLLYLPHHLQAL